MHNTALKRRFFPGLNGVRGLAALMVIFSHLNFVTDYFAVDLPFVVPHFGRCAVTMFFVLSGYLITYQLLEERDHDGQISLRNFYIRRVLRIWPVYFVVTFITLGWAIANSSLFIDQAKELKAILLYVFMLPNVALALDYRTSTGTVLWSVGVEEQFYLIWPLLFFFFKKPIRIILGTISIYFLLKIISYIYFKSEVYYFFVETRIDCMAIGGLGAYIIKNNSKIILKWMYLFWIQLICLLILCITLLWNPIVTSFWYAEEIYALVFLTLIINVSTNPKAILSLKNPILDFLGKISYGLYMYHMTIMALLGYLLKYRLPNTSTSYGFIAIAIIALTIAFSYLSYRYFETPFLKMKDKLTAQPSN